MSLSSFSFSLIFPLLLPQSRSHSNLQLTSCFSSIITNPPVSLLEPFNFARSDPADYSLVELKTLKALGVDPKVGFPFKPTGPRERVVPERLKVQNQMLEEEKKRLAALAA